jgi:hypothetical protein
MKLKLACAALSFLSASMSFTAPAKAEGDALIAGALGFGVGTLFGSAVSGPRYVAPAPVYLAPEPVYIAPPQPVYQAAPVYYVPAPYSAEWYQSCSARYRSFDPRDGSYLAVDGRRYMCR